jgi:coenzyme F420-0:L-glutamate ligase/coenzyme F420-1:gamma-L-glutamate ligase
MKDEIKIIGLKGIPLIEPGDCLDDIILTALKENNVTLNDGDIILIAQSIVSKSLGLIKDLKDVKPSQKAVDLYNEMLPFMIKHEIPVKNPELIQVILDESKSIIKARQTLIVETKQGFICANAGVDKSNVRGDSKVTLLPEDSDKEAEKIRTNLEKKAQKNVAVIITDSFGRAFRVGAVGVAVGLSGISALLDKRGSVDLYGKELKSTIVAQVDNLASTAQLLMGESNEGIPVVLIRGYKFERKEHESIQKINREKDVDLFRTSTQQLNTIDILKSRRSYKSKFQDKDVDMKHILESIEIARWAPSAHNNQPWRYVIFKRGKFREDLIDQMNQKLREDLTEEGVSDELICNKIQKTRVNFIEAPYLILLCIDNSENLKYDHNEFLMKMQSASASATYLLLAFHTKGLSACWYCAPLFTQEIIRKYLSLPKTFIPIAFFTVGYPTRKQKVPLRKKLNEVLYEVEKN